LHNSDIEKADIVYACALCLSQETREALASRLQGCRDGTYLVSVGWNPNKPWLHSLESFSTSFSWGEAPVYLKQIRFNEAPLDE